MLSLFKQRLNKILDDADLPDEHLERVEAFARIFALKRHQVSAILNGKIPDSALLERIAQEFEVKAEWLHGKDVSSKEIAKITSKDNQKETLKIAVKGAYKKNNSVAFTSSTEPDVGKLVF